MATKTLALLAAALLLPAPRALAQSRTCYRDTLSQNVGQGRVLITDKGWVFETAAGEDSLTARWRADSNLLLCVEKVLLKGGPRDSWTMVNTDSGEQAGVQRIK